MSSIKLTADSNGGTFELKAPASSSNTRVLTLPDTADGTILTTTNPKAGNIIQVISASKTDTFVTNSTSYTDITGLSVSITPSSTSSKVLVMMECVVGVDNNVSAFLRMVRDSTAIHVGDAVGNRIQSTAGNGDDPSSQFPLQMSGVFLDSPATTSATTYKIQANTEASGNTGNIMINRAGTDADNNQHGRYASSITVMEVAG